MSDKILFQRDRLTVTDSHVTVGHATIFYSSISAVSIYQGRPMLPAAIVAGISLIPVVFFSLAGARVFGPHFPRSAIALACLPLIALVAIGFLYEVKGLVVTIDGHAVTVLKSNKLVLLERAKAAIKEAKKAQSPSHA